MSLVQNQSAKQKFVDGNTTGVIDDPGSPYDGMRVSLVFDDVDLSNGAPLVMLGGVIAALLIGDPAADLTVDGTLTVTGDSTFNGAIDANEDVTIATGKALTLDGDATLTVGTGAAALGGSLAVAGDVGFNGATPVGLSAAYTLTYSTAARTVPAATASDVATTGSALTSYGYTQAQADSIPVAINAAIADTLAVKKVVVALINDLVAVGIAQL